VPHVNRPGRAALTAAAATALVAGALAFAAPAQASSARMPIAGTHPSWATPSNRVSPQAVTSGTVDVRVYLAGRNQAGLAAYAKAVSTPGNALYGHYLSPSQVRAAYGPTSAQISAVQKWVTGAGLTVTNVKDEMGGYVEVTGSVQDAVKAFGVTFGTFKGPDGKRDRAPEQTATAPAGVAGAVLAVSGLDTANHVAKPADDLPPPGPNYWVASPCSQYYGQKIATDKPSAYGTKHPYAVCGYTQRQIRGAYNVSKSGMTGKGVTVAIVDAFASPTMPGDANQFAAVTGDKPFRPGQYTQVLAPSFNSTDICDAPGWYGEQTLDIEAVHGQAPDANVVFVGAASCFDTDLLDSISLIVSNHLASIVSNSYGEPAEFAQPTLPAYEQLFRAGAAEGIGFFFSSGDNGYESPAEDPGSDFTQTDYPSESPNVTSVGGTSLAVGKNNNYQFETSWGVLADPLAADGKSWQSPPPGIYPDDYLGSGGGGVSSDFVQPSYQKGIVPNSLATRLPNGTINATPMRVEPDVAAVADSATGMLVGQTTLQPNGVSYAFSLSRIGGTSVACPVFAGIEADAQQAAGHVLGFANPAIYQRFGTSAFRDVTDHPLGPGFLALVRNNYTDPFTKTGPLITFLRTLGINGEGADALPAVKGYDDATGVGSPRNYIESFR
jgi:subtilase family serine protease